MVDFQNAEPTLGSSMHKWQAPYLGKAAPEFPPIFHILHFRSVKVWIERVMHHSSHQSSYDLSSYPTHGAKIGQCSLKTCWSNDHQVSLTLCAWLGSLPQGKRNCCWLQFYKDWIGDDKLWRVQVMSSFVVVFFQGTVVFYLFKLN
jgi:hypothetical protein